MENWNGTEIEVAHSARNVIATVDPWQNMLHGVDNWPPPELIQKLYQSRQVRAFEGENATLATKHHGFYSDLQSMHSEDAITWSYFGALAYEKQDVRDRFVASLLKDLQIKGNAHGSIIWLWRRIPHPHTLVSGGPEVDFGIQTVDTFLLGESKWRSDVAKNQGKEKDATQIQLRELFCNAYGRKIFPKIKNFCVLAVSRYGQLVEECTTEAERVGLLMRDRTWNSLAEIGHHPHKAEFQKYLAWKQKHSKK